MTIHEDALDAWIYILESFTNGTLHSIFINKYGTTITGPEDDEDVFLIPDHKMIGFITEKTGLSITHQAVYFSNTTGNITLSFSPEEKGLRITCVNYTWHPTQSSHNRLSLLTLFDKKHIKYCISIPPQIIL